MMRITSPRQRAVLAMLIFNKLRQKDVIAQIISNMPKDMRYINVDPEDIADRLNMAGFYTGLRFYKPFWPWSKAYAMVKTGNYGSLYLSDRRLDRSLESLCGSIAHEWGHCLEFWWKKHMEKGQYFNHGDNRRKDDTFQYQLGIRVKEYVADYREELLRSIGYIR